METVTFSTAKNTSNVQLEDIITFEPFDQTVGLPFPLYLDPIWKFLLATTLLITLVQGTRLRVIIMSYFKSPETKLGPINSLILMDQLNGFFLGYIVLVRTIFILSPFPVSSLLGETFCRWNTFPGIDEFRGYWNVG